MTNKLVPLVRKYYRKLMRIPEPKVERNVNLKELGKFFGREISSMKQEYSLTKGYIAHDFQITMIDEVMQPLENLFPKFNEVARQYKHLVDFYHFFPNIYDRWVYDFYLRSAKDSYAFLYHKEGNLQDLLSVYLHLGNKVRDKMKGLEIKDPGIIFPSFMEPMKVALQLSNSVRFYMQSLGVARTKEAIDRMWNYIEKSEVQSQKFGADIYPALHRHNILEFFHQQRNHNLAFQNIELYLDTVDELQKSRRYKKLDKAFVNMVEAMPLNINVRLEEQDNPVTNYLKLVNYSLRQKNKSVLDTILKEENWRHVFENIANTDLVKAITQKWGGPSGLFAQAPEAQLKILGEYTNYEVEKKLIEESSYDIFSRIKSNKILYILDLGIGDGKKLVPLIKNALGAGYEKAILCGVDGHAHIVKEAAKNLESGLKKEISSGDVEISMIACRFEGLTQNPDYKQFRESAREADYIATFLGTSFCNSFPDESCEFLKSTGAKFHLSGIYLKGEGAYQAQYASSNARNLSLPFAYVQGLAPKQVQKMSFESVMQLISINTKNENLAVDAVVGRFVPKYRVKGALGQVFNPSHPVNCWFSIKYSDPQIKQIFGANEFKVLDRYSAHNNVSLYLTENIGR